MPRFRTPEERARYMVEAGIAVDEFTVMLIGEAEPEKIEPAGEEEESGIKIEFSEVEIPETEVIQNDGDTDSTCTDDT